MEKSIKIFFSAPSLVAKDQEQKYSLIRDLLADFGDITYDWLKDKLDYNPKSWAERAKDGIRRADVVVAEISTPSTGVGLQIAYANSHKIPVITLINENTRSKSPFSANMGGSMITEVVYNDENLSSKLSKVFQNLVIANFVKFNFISTSEINQYLEQESSRLGMTRSEYLRRLVRNSMHAHKRKSE